jgi:hypothetical protein
LTALQLIDELHQVNPRDEVFVVVHDMATYETLRGIAWKVIRDGTGAGKGQFEIYAKA